MPSVLLISTYDLGRQPFGLASAAAALRAAGAEVTCVDLSRDRLAPEQVEAADLVGFFLPMHTATRLAVPVIDRVRELNPARAALRVRALRAAQRRAGCASAASTTSSAASSRTISSALVDGSRCVRASDPDGRAAGRRSSSPTARRPAAAVALRARCRSAARRKVVGYTEASRGCKHLCRHCPIVPVYDGRFRVVPVDVVLADVARRSRPARGTSPSATPISSTASATRWRVVDALHAEFPGLTYDVTIKVEHLLKHATCCRGCATPAACSSRARSNRSTTACSRRLDKGHTRARLRARVALCREAGLTLVADLRRRSRRGRRWRATASCSRRSIGSSWSSTSRRFSSRSGCS